MLKTGDASGIQRLSLTADGTVALVGTDDGGVEVWSLATLANPERLTRLAHPSSISDVAVSSDGRTAAVVSRGEGYLWDLTDASHPSLYTRLPGVRGIALSGDGRRAMTAGVSDGGTQSPVRLWDLADRRRPRALGSLTTDANRVAITPDGRTALAGTPHGVTTLWDLRNPSRPALRATLKGPAKAVEDVVLSADGDTAMLATPRWGAFSWNVRGISGDPLRDLCGSGDQRADVALSRERWAAISGGQKWPSYFGGLAKFDPCD
ncbi:WD40 repeat domain-containing protein [Nonomuraea helvata]|uniref:WD40 repeat domain-containing protein n=1 Tax=Nonomuraea helvata TaxID=37484 RepID=A0ABV5SA48_9ACTN